MNKKLAFILAIALCLSSCGSTGTDTPSQAETTTTTTAETTTTTTAATTTAETKTVTSISTVSTITETDDNEEDSDIKEVNEMSDEEAISELIWETDEFKITYKGTTKEKNGIAFNVLIENNSEQDVKFQTRDVSVNDYQSRVAFSTKVQSGKKKNYDLRLIYEELDKNNIAYDDVQCLEFKFIALGKSYNDVIAESEPIKLSMNGVIE